MIQSSIGLELHTMLAQRYAQSMCVTLLTIILKGGMNPS